MRAAPLCALGVACLSSCRLPGQTAKIGRGPVSGHSALASRAMAAAGRSIPPPSHVATSGEAIPRPPGAGQSPPVRSNGEAESEDKRDAPPPSLPAAVPVFAARGTLAQRLKAVVDDAVARGVTHRVGIAVYDLATGQAVGLDAASTFRPASVIKLAVLVAAYRARSGMASAQFKPLRPDLERMITISDNAATRRLVRRLGAHAVNEAIGELGIKQFRVGESGSRDWVLMGSKAAPADTALLLAKIARREVVSREACDEMLALLGAQEKRGRIPAGLSAAPGLWVGNKTGTLNGVVNDAGIVLQPPRGIGYTLAIFTSGTRSEPAGEKFLADLSATVYGYMAARGRNG